MNNEFKEAYIHIYKHIRKKLDIYIKIQKIQEKEMVKM